MSLSNWSSHCNFTYHNVDQVGDSVDERPDPLSVSLWVDGTGRRANGRTPRALLGVHLHEMKGPKQMLWAATLWEEEVTLDQLPYTFNDVYGSPKKLTEMPLLCRRRVDRARRPVLDLPGQCLKVRCEMAQGMIPLFVVGRLDGGHRLWWRMRRGEGRGGSEGWRWVVVWCVMCDV